MKLAHRLLLPAMAFFAINAHGQTEELPSATIDGTTYTVTSLEDHTCELTKSSDECLNFSPDFVIPATVEIEGEEYSVTSISYMWSNSMIWNNVADFFKTISIPSTLTEISVNAFNNIRSLTDIFVAEDNPALASADGVLFNADKTTLIRMPRKYFSTRPELEGRFEIPTTVNTLGAHAFYHCDELKDISIPESVSDISEYCFEYCTALERVIIPDNVTSIPYAFGNCSSLKELVLGKGMTNVGQIVGSYIYSIECHATEPPACERDENFYDIYQNCILTVPLGCKEAYAAAKGWSNFAYIVEKDFSSAEKAYSATVGDFTYTITSETERTCQLSSCPVSGKTKIIIPPTVDINGTTYSVTSISHSWLSKVQRETVRSITLPATVTDIHHIALSLFPELQNIFVTEGNPALTSVNGILFNADKTTLIRMPIDYYTNLEGRYAIPSTVTKLEDQAFYCCKGLKHITLPETLTSIGLNSFARTSLLEINIPDNVTEMKSHPYKYFGTFYNCSLLTFAHIGNGVTTIPYNIFLYCRGLKSIHFGDKVTAITSNMLYVMDDYVEVYLEDVSFGEGTTSVAAILHPHINNTITCCATVPPVCEADENFSSFTYAHANLIVPYGCKEAYAAAKGWSGFANITESEVISGIDAATDGMATAADVRYENGTLTCDAWDNGTRVTVYTANGSIMLSATANDGKVEFPAVAGLYIVAANGSTTKVLVR